MKSSIFYLIAKQGKKFFIWGILIVFALSCCKKKADDPEPTPEPVDLTAEQDYSAMVSNDQGVDREMDIVLKDTLFYKNGSSALNCGTVNVLDNSWPNKLIEINYGSSTICADGRTRKGKILISITKPWSDTGSVVTINYASFFMDSFNIRGYKKYTYYSSVNNDSLRVYTWDKKDTIITPNSKILTLSSTITKRWFRGSNSTDLDDFYHFIISESGKNARGDSFSVSNTQGEELVRYNGCPYFQKGIVTIQTPKFKRRINFGYPSNACDNVAGVYDFTTGQLLGTVTLK